MGRVFMLEAGHYTQTPCLSFKRESVIDTLETTMIVGKLLQGLAPKLEEYKALVVSLFLALDLFKKFFSLE